MTRLSRLACAAAVAGASFLGLPAVGQAATGFKVTGDDGQPAQVAGQTIRHMSPQVTADWSPGDKYFKATVSRPDGSTADIGGRCSPTTGSWFPAKIDYTGPGSYLLTITTWQEPRGKESTCEGKGTQVQAAFTIAPSISLINVPPRVLTRLPGRPGTGGGSILTHNFGFNPNPGADTNEVVFQGPGLPPEGRGRTADATNPNVVTQIFTAPGIYTLTPRAISYRFAQAPVLGAPVRVQVLDPFDFGVISLTDRTGPSYKLGGYIRTKFMGGSKLRLEVRRRGAKKWRRVSTGRVGKRTREIKWRFKLRKTGRYNARIRFRGNSNVAPGEWKGSFRVKTYRRYFRR